MNTKLGLLERVELRSIWENEEKHFTPWLAEEDNIALLGETLGMNLEVEALEKQVGPFRADILCKDIYSENWVLIENQLEKTDHLHLGQLLTYAAGLQAVTIIWVASEFRDDHRAALDWLNEITDDKIQFFGLEVELWKIGESPAAPKFNIISKPNEWSKQAGKAARSIGEDELSEIKRIQLEFWDQLFYLVISHTGLRPQKPVPGPWLIMAIGRSGSHLAGLVNSRENTLAVELCLSGKNGKSFYHQLWSQKDEIEDEIKLHLTWKELPQNIVSRIMLFRENSDLTERGHWQEYLMWHKDTLVKFDQAFRGRVRKLRSG